MKVLNYGKKNNDDIELKKYNYIEYKFLDFINQKYKQKDTKRIILKQLKKRMISYIII